MKGLARFAVGFAVVAGLAGTACAQDAAALARAEEIVGGRCFLCHGMEGEAASAVFPRLAGQHWEYIAKQLGDFKSGKRKSETMKPQSEELTPEDMKALGHFFEKKQVPGREVSDADLVAVGRFVFQRGNQFSGLPSCSSCHGAKGHGTPQLPRLAGQHPRYTEEQLRLFNNRERTNDNAVMHTVASKLSDLERHAVAAYIATLD
ncbi:cytochrome c [Azonexus sp.]|uniref:c-type cytochrome n=1 Tax=Azonexus sp. TaxID=1872668 RepID=UPI0035B350B2